MNQKYFILCAGSRWVGSFGAPVVAVSFAFGVTAGSSVERHGARLLADERFMLMIGALSSPYRWHLFTELLLCIGFFARR